MGIAWVEEFVPAGQLRPGRHQVCVHGAWETVTGVGAARGEAVVHVIHTGGRSLQFAATELLARRPASWAAA